MTTDSTPATGATDAVRCLYLARMTEQLGQPAAAQRWYEKANRWLETIDHRAVEPPAECELPKIRR